jgi:hypothetical protein
LGVALSLEVARRFVNVVGAPGRRAEARKGPAAARQPALRRELELARQTRGVPGTALAFNDNPEH